MTVAVDHITVERGGHAVQFYDHDSELASCVSGYLLDGARAGAVSIVIATEAHRDAFTAELRAAGIDIDAARREGTLVLLDAATTLAKFTRSDRIEAAAFHQVIGSLIAEAGRDRRSVIAYGEMVALLWGAGDVLGAIELEKLWNELGQELEFSLLCGYHNAAVAGSEHAEALREVCHLHSSVLSPPSPERAPHPERAHRPERAPHDYLRPTREDRPGELSNHFAPAPEAPRAARRFVCAALERWGTQGDLLDDAELVASELATNAVIHARTPFSVSLRQLDGGVRLSVRDATPTRPVLQEENVAAASGRGLRLVSRLASSWGVQTTADGKAVWAELRR